MLHWRFEKGFSVIIFYLISCDVTRVAPVCMSTFKMWTCDSGINFYDSTCVQPTQDVNTRGSLPSDAASGSPMPEVHIPNARLP